MANKPTTESYFVKRLRDSGYLVDRVPVKFGMQDPRSWMVVIDQGNASILATCYRNLDGPDSNYIEFYDGDQYIPKRFRLTTNSMETIIEWLNNFGIVNKTFEYNTKKPRKPAPAESFEDDYEE
jgi:hypothetical protein